MQHINSSNFQETINEGVTVVDFFANWCGPCRMLSPLLEECEKTYEGKVKFVKVDVDENQDLAVKFKVMSIPNLIIFKNGEVVDQHVGYMPIDEVKKFVEKAL